MTTTWRARRENAGAWRPTWPRSWSSTPPRGRPDGFHDFTIGQEGEESPAFTGILVQNGKFAPHTSASAIYLAQCRREGVAALNWGRRVVWVHHRFIEALEWRGDHFRVSLGS